MLFGIPRELVRAVVRALLGPHRFDPRRLGLRWALPDRSSKAVDANVGADAQDRLFAEILARLRADDDFRTAEELAFEIQAGGVPVSVGAIHYLLRTQGAHIVEIRLRTTAAGCITEFRSQPPASA